MNRYPLLQAVTWLISCIAVILLGMSVRLAPVERTLAWPLPNPWPGGDPFLLPAALALAGAALLALFVLAGSARGTPAARPWGELLLYYTALYAFEWMILPTGAPGALTLVLAALLLTGGAWLFWRGPHLLRDSWTTTTGVSLLDAAFILGPAVLGLALGQSPEHHAVGFSLLLYPLYALVQLGLFLKLPVTRLRAMGVSAAGTRLIAAVLFALVHWPNPLVMLVTLLGMFVWAQQYQRGRPLWQLALVMGLTATTFSQMLPDDLTHHMRVGPGYVRAAAVDLLGGPPAPNAQEKTMAFLKRIYPQTVGRTMRPDEEIVLRKTAAATKRHIRVQAFFSSPEYRRRAEAAGRPLPPSALTHWSRWPEPWRGRVRELGSEAYFQEHGGTMRSFLRALYQDLLQRTPSEAELDSWQAANSGHHRRRWVEILLDHRLEKGEAGFTEPDIRELRLWM